jgi:hypothetical protein
LLTSRRIEEEKKIFCSMLGKLYVSKDSDVEKIRTVYELASQTIEVKNPFKPPRCVGG